MNNLKKTDTKYLIMKRKGKPRYLRVKKFQKGICLKNIKTYGYPQRIINTWNGLKEEVIMAKNVHQLKEKLDKYRYEDKTTRV